MGNNPQESASWATMHVHESPTMIIGIALLVSCTNPTICAQTAKAQPALALGAAHYSISPTLVTVRTISFNAVVVVRDGKIEAGRARIPSEDPKKTPRIDYKGTCILPGLIDGFAGLNSQAQANAWLYMGVATIVGLKGPTSRVLEIRCSSQPAHLSAGLGWFDGLVQVLDEHSAQQTSQSRARSTL
jgi:hypothetical protein